MKEIHPAALTVAGSDSGGNAGVQADLRAFHAYNVHGCTVFTALTAQNPSGVSAIHVAPPDFVAAQLDAVLGVYDIRALKTGMLADAAVVEAVADRLAAHPEIAKVIDPVMIATSGAKLLPDGAIDVVTTRLLPLATLITPNLPEAEILAGEIGAGRTADVDRAKHLAAKIADRYGCATLVKGGHGVNAAAVDVLATPDASGRFEEFTAPWIPSPVSTHGTGCSLAAALAAELALGATLPDAVRGAKEYVHQAIANSYFVGDDCGVLGFVHRR